MKRCVMILRIREVSRTISQYGTTAHRRNLVDPDPSQHRYRSTPPPTADLSPRSSQGGHGRSTAPPLVTREFEDADESHLIRGYD